ncbi:MAG: hypothetical protein HF978_04490 [Desulfobacteraceae bacterium]|nr:hypothetical protein [Desulfobacteraceae bacterium]MBC2754787.1 hypothetical protein [Desulfobacteraceae bacterium]
MRFIHIIHMDRSATGKTCNGNRGAIEPLSAYKMPLKSLERPTVNS